MNTLEMIGTTKQGIPVYKYIYKPKKLIKETPKEKENGNN